MLTAILFFLSVYGLANAIAVLKVGRYFLGEGYCYDPACTMLDHPLDKRRGPGTVPYLGDMLYCPPCLSFWIGVGFSLFIVSPAALVVYSRGAAALVDGLAACGMSYLIHVVMERTAQGVKTL